MSEWQDLIVGDRMAVDQEFSRRVTESEFSSQQWGLVMTATEFRVEDADDPEHARTRGRPGRLQNRPVRPV